MKKGDYVVVGVILLIAASIFYFSVGSFNNVENKKIVISIDGEIYREIPLNSSTKDEDIYISSKYGENVIEIENGYVHMHEADCSDQICVKIGAISEPGQSIICLPNRLIVTIESNNSDVDVVLK